jgi:hypothetical protein
MDIADYISLPLPKFLRVTGISRERCYRLLHSRDLRSFLLGSRRYIDVQSYRDLISRQQAGDRRLPAPPSAPRRRRTEVPGPRLPAA